jgi:hypothetical protein
MRSKAFLRISATLFALVALAHLMRLAMGWTVLIGTWALPLWPSAIAVIGAGALSFIGLRLARTAG